jgi:DNA-binding CsgD family transcriptional regulator
MSRKVDLTPREHDLVRGLTLGLSNRDLAASLGVRDKTVRNQLTVLYEKLGVAGRLQLALLVTRQPEPVEEDAVAQEVRRLGRVRATPDWGGAETVADRRVQMPRTRGRGTSVPGASSPRVLCSPDLTKSLRAPTH